MKHITSLIAAIFAFIVVFTGCGGKADMSITIPDTANIDQFKPVFVGNFGEHFKFTPEAYTIDFGTDSDAVLTMHVRLQKPFYSSATEAVTITDGDTLKPEAPYVMFIDDNNQPVSDVKLQMDSAAIDELTALLGDLKGTKGELTFKTSSKLSKEAVQAIAQNAKSLRIVGCVDLRPDPKRIADMLSAYHSAASKYNSTWTPANKPKNETQYNKFIIDHTEVKAAEEEIARMQAYMTDSQRIEFQIIKHSIKWLQIVDRGTK